MFRERCGCGAEFETDDDKGLRLLREWRRKHKCIQQQTGNADLQTTSETVNDGRQPELHIGFRPEWEGKNGRHNNT
jgi:hypothetical protein